jgi:hypothetical protein
MEIDRHKQIEADEHIREICREIVAQNKSITEWDQIESDDMFQSGPYEGGYDATEQEFLFSYYDATGTEYWFDFSLEIAQKIAKGDQYFLDLRESQ